MLIVLHQANAELAIEVTGIPIIFVGISRVDFCAGRALVQLAESPMIIMVLFDDK